MRPFISSIWVSSMMCGPNPKAVALASRNAGIRFKCPTKQGKLSPIFVLQIKLKTLCLSMAVAATVLLMDNQFLGMRVPDQRLVSRTAGFLSINHIHLGGLYMTSWKGISGNRHEPMKRAANELAHHFS